MSLVCNEGDLATAVDDRDRHWGFEERVHVAACWAVAVTEWEVRVAVAADGEVDEKNLV